MLRAGNTRWAQTEEIQHCQQPDVNNSSRHVWTFPALCLKLATAPLFTPYLLSPPCDSRLKITPSAGRRAVPSMPTLKAPLGVTAPPPLLAQRSHTGPPAGAGTQRAPRGYRARRGSPPGAERSTAVSTLPSPQRPPLGPGAAPAELSAGSGRRERRSRAGFQVGSDEAARPRAEQSNSALLRDGRGAARTHRRSVPALRGRPRRRGSVTARSVLTPEAPLTARGERLRLRAPPGMTPPTALHRTGPHGGAGIGGDPHGAVSPQRPPAQRRPRGRPAEPLRRARPGREENFPERSAARPHRGYLRAAPWRRAAAEAALPEGREGTGRGKGKGARCRRRRPPGTPRHPRSRPERFRGRTRPPRRAAPGQWRRDAAPPRPHGACAGPEGGERVGCRGSCAPCVGSVAPCMVCTPVGGLRGVCVSV